MNGVLTVRASVVGDVYCMSGKSDVTEPVAADAWKSPSFWRQSMAQLSENSAAGDGNQI